ncbi:MAG: UPF0149 family protein [bacterium]|nr:UPF0149 family protein [bacterium]
MLMNQKKKLSISELKILDQHIITNFDQIKTEEKELEINKDIYWVEGYLCALTSSPEPMIKMDFWVPYINGADCVFESAEHTNTTISLIFSLRNNIVDKLNNESYKPLYETHNLKNEPKETLITKWAKGYLFATLLFHADLLDQEEEIARLLVPIIMATEGPFSKEAVKSGVSKKEAFKLIPKIVLAFDKICRERRHFYLEELKNSNHNSNHNPHIITHDFKVGRNNPCPCGSGKKFKKCCLLKKETLH